MKDVEKLDPSYILRKNTKWCSHFGKVLQFLKRFKRKKLLNDPAIPLLGIYPRELKTYAYVHTRTCTWIFTVTSCTVAKK